MNTLGNRKKKKLKGCTHKDTYISVANYCRQQLLVTNNAKALHFQPNCPLYKFSNILSLILIKVLEIRENFEKIKGAYLLNYEYVSC